MGTGVISQGLKRPGREADKSHSSSAELKNKWISNYTPTYAFMARTVTLYGLSFFLIGCMSVKDFIAVWLSTCVCVFFILCHAIGQSVPTFGRHSVREPLDP